MHRQDQNPQRLTRSAWRRSIQTLTACAAAASVTLPLAADIIVNIGGPDLVNIKVTHMPDLDQRRVWDDNGTPLYVLDDIVGLPNGGEMYCVPTSIMNLFIYAANHGFPGLAPGPGTWSEWTDYNAAGLNLITLGQLMDTDPVDGTTGGAVDGMFDWIQASGDAGDFLILSKRRSGADYPLARELAGFVQLGGVASFCYGRYPISGYFLDIPVTPTREGGHCVTFTRYVRNGSSQLLGYRDPASDSQFRTWQSAWHEKTVTITDIPVWEGVPPFGHLSFVSAINHPADDGIIRAIDSVYVLLPRFGLSYSNTPAGAKVTKRKTFPINWPAQDNTPDDVQLNLAGAIKGWAPKPYETSAWTLIAEAANTPTVLHVTDLHTGEATALPDAPTGLKQVVAGRKGGLYGTDGTSVFHLAEGDGTIITQITLPDIDALAYDDAADEVLALSSVKRAVYRLHHSLDGQPAVMPVPGSVPMSNVSDIVADPIEPGRVWFITSAHDSIYGLFANGPAIDLDIIDLPAVQSPTALEVDERGRLYVTCNGIVIVLSRLGGWHVDNAAAMHGKPVGDGFTIGRSRRNDDPQDFVGPQWRNVAHDALMDLPETADCLGDLNFDGIIDGLDLGDFLAAWGQPGRADLDGDGVVAGNDLGILLSAWGPCGTE